MNRNLDFGGGLRRIRKMWAFTQKELADRTSLSTTCISSLERNLKMPNLQTISAIATGLEMKIYELIKAIEEHQEDE
jgi:DNA-binding XRE family transcriptional regulator